MLYVYSSSVRGAYSLRRKNLLAKMLKLQYIKVDVRIQKMNPEQEQKSTPADQTTLGANDGPIAPQSGLSTPSYQTTNQIEIDTGSGIGAPNSLRVVKVSTRSVGLITVAFGLLALLIGYIVYSQSRLPSNYLRTPGTVNSETTSYNNGGVAPNTTGGSAVTYQASISFKVGSYTYNFIDTNAPKYSTGQTVQVAYNPANPEQNPKNASDNTGSVMGPLVMVVGAVLFVIGLLMSARRPVH